MGTLKEKVYRLNAAVNDHDLNPIGDMYAADAELVWPGLGPTKGRTPVLCRCRPGSCRRPTGDLRSKPAASAWSMLTA